MTKEQARFMLNGQIYPQGGQKHVCLTTTNARSTTMLVKKQVTVLLSSTAISLIFWEVCVLRCRNLRLFVCVHV